MLNAVPPAGETFALDDFGTGYSSLAYLKQLPASVLKIDQSFVREMMTSADDLSIISGVVGMAKTFGLQVIAEGVESAKHGNLLLRLGCEQAQNLPLLYAMVDTGAGQWIWNNGCVASVIAHRIWTFISARWAVG